MNATAEMFEGVASSNVHEGDRLQFMTRETGFNGRGLYSRTGTVVKVTAKTVRVDCRDSGEGTAVLRRDLVEWHSRAVRRVVVEKPARRPYDAQHVQIVDQGLTVTALYIPDSEQAKTPEQVWDNITDRAYAAVEVVATMRRFYKSEGAMYSGWIVESGMNRGEPIPNKREAIEQLRHAIADYFTR